jgi:hypothetical protein
MSERLKRKGRIAWKKTSLRHNNPSQKMCRKFTRNCTVPDGMSHLHTAVKAIHRAYIDSSLQPNLNIFKPFVCFIAVDKAKE